MSRFLFGRWQLIPQRRELLADGQQVALGARAFDVLHALLEARGATVPAAEMPAKVWPGVVVEESNLRAQILGLRKALGPEGTGLIANVARRGYRFAGEVRELPDATVATARDMATPPSIAVVPFRTLSSDARQDYFAEGIAEDLTTSLSRFG